MLENVHKRPVVPGHVWPRKKEENELNVGGAGVKGGISGEEEEDSFAAGGPSERIRGSWPRRAVSTQFSNPIKQTELFQLFFHC